MVEYQWDKTVNKIRCSGKAAQSRWSVQEAHESLPNRFSCHASCIIYVRPSKRFPRTPEMTRRRRRSPGNSSNCYRRTSETTTHHLIGPSYALQIIIILGIRVLPTHVSPSWIWSGEQEHVKLPTVLTHCAGEGQVCSPSKHSSLSVGRYI